MILKIEKDKYYGHQGKTKKLFMQVYGRVPKLKWMEKVELNGDIVDGWFSVDKKEYLLKLPMEGEFKRFTGNSERMFEFLKSHGAIEVEGEEKGTHIDYNDQKGFLTQQDRFGTFVGADIINHYRVEEILKGMPDSWGIKWSNKSISPLINDNIVSLKETKEITKNDVAKVIEIMHPKKKVIIKRVIRRKINAN